MACANMLVCRCLLQATLPVAVLADQPIAETAVLAAAYLAQLKYDSVVLELITTGAVIAFIFRAFLGYKRLNERCATHCRHLCAGIGHGLWLLDTYKCL